MATPSLRSARRWTLVATILGSSMTFIDGTVVNVALPALQADLQATIADIQWVIEAYALLLGTLILAGGSLGDQFGRRRVFLLGMAVFTLASIGCGLAGSTRLLIAARAIQGGGAAFLVPGSLAIISATFEDADRGRAIGTWSGFSSIAAAIGPVVGGWLIEHVSWRAVFFLNVPLAVIVFALSVRFMPETRDASRGFRVDYPGTALAVLGLGALVYALLEYARLSTTAVAALSGGGVLALVALVLVERTTADPMLPLELFASRTFALANALTLLLYAALNAVFWLVPLNLIQVQRYSATAAGAALLPFSLLMLLLSRWSGGLTDRVGSRLPLTVGPIVAAVGLLLFTRLGNGGSYWTTVLPAVTVLGLGMAGVVAPLTTTVMNAVPAQHAGVASGVNNAVSRVAGLIAVAVFGLVLVRVFDARAERALDRLELTVAARAAIDRELPKLAGAEIDASVGDRQQRAARDAIDRSFSAAFGVVMIAAAAVALGAAAMGAMIR
ncbi:MAG TPA: MFS transporter [Vicinamibacterales bacterium]